MANSDSTRKLVLDFKIQTAESAKSIADMRKALKGLIDAQADVAVGTKEWKKLSKAINDTEGRIGDLNDSFKTLQGTGIERASSGFSLLGEGMRNLDFGKVKIGLAGLKTALASTGIMLIVQAVGYLISNFDELSQGSNGLSKALKLVGDYVKWFIDTAMKLVNVVTDLFQITSEEQRKLEEQWEANKKAAEAAIEALGHQMKAFERQAAIAKAAGKETIEIEKQKQQAIIDTNLAIAKQIQSEIESGAILDDERKKRLTASLEAIKDAKTQQYVIEQEQAKKITEKEEEHTKKLKEENKKRSDDKKKETDDLFAAAVAEGEKEEAFRTKEIEKRRAEEKKIEEDRLKLLEQMKQQEKDISLKADRDLIESQKAGWAEEDRLRKEASEAHKKDVQDRFDVTKQSLQTTQALTDLVFSFRLNQLKKGSAEEIKVRKRQFEVEKAFKVAQIVMDGIQGAMKAYAMNPLPSPIGVISAGLQGVAAAAAAIKVAATKFDAGQAPSVDTGGLSLGGGGTQAPNTQAPTTQVQPFTRLDEEGNVTGKSTTVKAYVVESEMTDSQKRVGRLEGQASFG